MLFLADTQAPESYKSIRIIWELLQFDEVLRRFQVFLVSDLKLYRLLVGLAGGRPKYACVNCKAIFSENKADRANNVAIWDKAAERGDSDSWKNHLIEKKYNL